MLFRSLRGVLYDKTMLYKAISGLNSIITITLAPEQQMGQENEMLKVKISEDKMEAIVRFYPQSNQGKALTKHDIIEDLKFNPWECKMRITFPNDIDFSLLYPTVILIDCKDFSYTLGLLISFIYDLVSLTVIYMLYKSILDI